MTRTEAAHINGALSKGPITARGKAQSSKNATSHGMNSKDVVIAGESQAEFDSLLACCVRRHAPADEIERSLVFEMAAARWRLRRIAGMETAVFDTEIERVAADTENPVAPEKVMTAAFSNLAGGKALANIHRYEVRLHRNYEKALAELAERQLTRVQNEPDADAKLRDILNEMAAEAAPAARATEFLDTCVRNVRSHAA